MAATNLLRLRASDELAKVRSFLGRERQTRFRYGVALVTTSLAVPAALLMDVTFQLHTNVLFLAAVAISAWYGGRGPGLLASALSVLIIAFVFPRMPSDVAFPWLRQVIYLAAFFLVAAIIGATTESLRAAEAEAKARAEELEKLNVELEQQMEEVQTLSEHLQESNDALAKAATAAESVAARTMRLQETTAALSKARTESEVADVVLGRGLAVIEGVRGILARMDGRRFQVIGAAGYPPNVSARVHALRIDDPTALTTAARSGEAVWLRSGAELRERYPWAVEQLGSLGEEQTQVAVPLRHGEDVVGAFSVSFANSTAVGTADQAFMLLVAQAAGDALFRAHSFDAEHVARREAETLAQARADVLGIVAHDLRNPLNVIRTVGSSLTELDHLPAAEQRMVAIMQRCGRQMNRLIGDLLDATRLQAGRLTLERTDVDVREILREAHESLQPLAAEHRIVLRFDAPEEKCVCHADEQRLLQILENLVGNALKFSPAGGHVTISARLASREVVFSVADDGPGIPEDARAHLFDSFWQARLGDRRGVGLGLTITKGIVEAHGGRIWVESTLGAGSTFSFAIPAMDRAGDRRSVGDRSTAMAPMTIAPPSAA